MDRIELKRQGFSPASLKAYGGLLFLLIGLVCLAVLVYTLIQATTVSIDCTKFNSYKEVFAAYATTLIPSLGLFIAALTSSFIGNSLLSAAGNANKHAIPIENKTLIEEMLRERNDEGISNFIRLSSLTGLTGTFTKLGISGLPLATIGLTVLFAMLALIFPEPGTAGGPSKINSSLLDLAKLTLGAFIGSFVQRQAADVQKQATEISKIAKKVDATSGSGIVQPSTINPIGK